jgi:hypothetical protein
MTYEERLAAFEKMVEARESSGEIQTPEQVQAQESARYADGNRVKWQPPTGEFEPVRNRRLKHVLPPKPSPWDVAKLKAKKKPKRKKGSNRYEKKAKELAHWDQLKASVLAQRGPTCERCKTPTAKPYLSRKNWKRKGRERPEDVELLCEDCQRSKYKISDNDPLSEEYRRIIG